MNYLFDILNKLIFVGLCFLFLTFRWFSRKHKLFQIHEKSIDLKENVNFVYDLITNKKI